MPSVAVLAADGFETIECLTMVDVMRRGGVRATLVSIMPTREVVSSLQIPVTCDALFDEINFDEYDCVVLPGGLPGATNLRADQRVCDVVCEFAATKHVAKIASTLAKPDGLLIVSAADTPAFLASRPAWSAGPRWVSRCCRDSCCWSVPRPRERCRRRMLER